MVSKLLQTRLWNTLYIEDGHKTSRLDILMAVLVIEKNTFTKSGKNLKIWFKAPRCLVFFASRKSSSAIHFKNLSSDNIKNC